MNFRYFKYLLLFSAISFTLSVNAEVLKIYNADQIIKSLELSSHMQFFEDSTKEISFSDIQKTDKQIPWKNSIIPKYWKSTFWARLEIENDSDNDLLFALFYKTLTFVDLYELVNDSLTNQYFSGLFRAQKELSTRTGPDHFNLVIKPNIKTVYFLKVNHTKGYTPKLFFSIQDEYFFHLERSKREKIEYFIFGAFLIFFLFCLINFFFNHYPPYLWLSIFTIAMSLYSFNMAGDLTTFFPNHPFLIWRLNVVFTSLSGISGILLIISFFNLKTLCKKCYSILTILLLIQIFQLIASQLIIEYSGNFRLMSLFAVSITLFFLPALIIIPLKVWNKLAPPQKMFSIAIFIYSFFLVIGLILISFFNEKSLLIISYLSNITSILAIIFFIIALGEQIRQIEVERNAILEEMNVLKSQQNKILEELVDFRTKELRLANVELQDSKEILLQRNRRIELLLRELHHRVKNNLQLISSFYDLRRDDPNKKSLKDITDEGQNRIRIMALVHDMLYHGDNSDNIEIKAFINQIVIYLDSFFNPWKNIVTKIECPELKFDMDTAIPLGLILNELLTNAYKHSGLLNNNLEISISIHSLDTNFYSLIVSDNGKELDQKIISHKTQSFGLHMIYLLSKQLNGNFIYKYDGKNNFIVNFMDSEGRRQIP